MSTTSGITFGRSESKNSILDSIKKSIEKNNIGSILKKRKHYKNAETIFRDSTGK
jgi:hypothetical protein